MLPLAVARIVRFEEVGRVIYVLGIVVFVLLLTFSVAWHEIGHMVPAKLLGVRVNQYFVGFGPTLWSRKGRETEYGVKAIPLGGFIRMAGMYPPERSGRPPKSSWRASLEDEVRSASRVEIAAAGENRSFYQVSAPRKAIIMLGGPTMNLILAFVLMVVVYSGIGVMSPSLALDRVTPCLDASGLSIECTADAAIKSPAAAAGLRDGDKITAWGGVKVKDWDSLVERIQETGDAAAAVSVERAGQMLELSVTPRPVEATDAAPARLIVGIVAGQERRGGSVGEVPGILWDQITTSAQIYARLPQLVWHAAVDTVTGKERAATSPVSIVGVARLTGELSDEVSHTGVADPWAARWSMWLSIAASFNLALWMFNLLPLLPLDGGHVLGAVIEGVRRTWARIRRRTKLPGPLDLARVVPVTYGVFGLLILMTVVLVAADIFNPIKLG